MGAKKSAWALLLAVGCVSGCSLPEHPYDYCGPVWQSGSNENCRPNYRAGSILNDDRPSAAAVDAAPILPTNPLPLPGEHAARKRSTPAKLVSLPEDWVPEIAPSEPLPLEAEAAPHPQASGTSENRRLAAREIAGR